MTTLTRKAWFLPAFAVGLGVACFVAFWLGDKPGDGLAALGVMVALAVVSYLGGRFDLIRGLRGDGRDEYWQRIDIHATAHTGMVLIMVIIGLCLWEWGHGRDGSPYTQLGAVAGVAYILSIAVLRLRS